MAHLLLAAGAAYLGYLGARKTHTAYVNAKSEMYAEQDMYNYYQPSMYHSHSYPGGYYGSHYHPSGYGYQSGYSSGYR
jgi:hypothetical protein